MAGRCVLRSLLRPQPIPWAVQLVVGAAEASKHFLPTISFSQLVQCLVRARIWQRVCHLSFSCEQWIGPVSHPMHALPNTFEIPVVTFLVLPCVLLRSTHLLLPELTSFVRALSIM